MTIEETRSNTGVFESDDGGKSEISISDDASPGDTLTIEYAADSQQIIVDDFDSTLELIADGTWDSSEPLTIRLTNENLDLNTLDDHDMAFTDDDLAVLVMGDPITLDNVRSVTTDHVGDAVDVNPRTFVVTLNATTDETPVNVVLTADQLTRLTDSAHSHYIHYIKNPADEALVADAITTDADILDEDGEPIDGTSTIRPDENGFQQIAVNPEADGRFIITFDTTDATVDLNTGNTWHYKQLWLPLWMTPMWRIILQMQLKLRLRLRIQLLTIANRPLWQINDALMHLGMPLLAYKFPKRSYHYSYSWQHCCYRGWRRL